MEKVFFLSRFTTFWREARNNTWQNKVQVRSCVHLLGEDTETV